MYAVIKTGGKQSRVTQGQRLEVELLHEEIGAAVNLRPVLLVDGDTVLSTPEELQAATVTAKVVGEVKGPKIIGFQYRSKKHSRKRWGHRQKYNTIEITGISAS